MKQGCRLARLLAKNTGNFVRETNTSLYGVGEWVLSAFFVLQKKVEI